MKYIYLLCLLFISCQKLQPSELMHEYGVVVAKQYRGEVNDMATGTGFSSNGGLIITTHNIHLDEAFNVVFKCEHGIIFTINRPELYMKLSEGDTVLIKYYELINAKGKLKDLDFVDANKI